MFWSKEEPPPTEEPMSLMKIIIYIWIGLIILQKINKYNENKKKQFWYSKTKNNKENNSENDTLKNIIGLKSVKKEIKYYMKLINNKEKYKEWDVKLPKGILLAGLPGTGKTLLVKTMAESLDIPVISVAGSSFVEMYVGVGASRVRKLFQEARSKDKCIIFIDEIDAVGGKRNLDNNSERASTLNQLLVEMDGFDESSNIMIFAATNLIK